MTSLSPLKIASLVSELDAGLTGAFVQKIRCAASPLVELELRRPRHSVLLVVSAEEGVARLGIKSKGEHLQVGGAPAPVQRALRAELVGARLERVLRHRGLKLALIFRRAEKERVLWVDLDPRQPRWVLTTEREARRVLATSDTSVRPGSAFDVSGFELGPEALADAANEALSAGVSALEASPQTEGAEDFPLARALERGFSDSSSQQRASRVRQRLLAQLKARRTKLGRTREKVRDEASRLPLAAEHRLKGELLTQNLGRVSRKDRVVRLTHYTEEGQADVEVKLDPARTPKEQAEWHFHQYRRLSRGVEFATKRLAELDAEWETLERSMESVRALDDEALLEHARGNVEFERVASGSKKKAAPPRAKPYREYRSAKGERIWVGKGGPNNDELTFHVASAHDLWLHALGVEGAHVIVPRNRDEAVLPELLLDAAHLALHASRARGQGGGEVAYTAAKFVRKPKGSAHGAVHYTREKVLAVRFDDARLARLLKSAEDSGPIVPGGTRDGD